MINEERVFCSPRGRLYCKSTLNYNYPVLAELRFERHFYENKISKEEFNHIRKNLFPEEFV